MHAQHTTCTTHYMHNTLHAQHTTCTIQLNVAQYLSMQYTCCSRYSLSTSLLLLLFVNVCLVFTTLNRGAT